MKFPLGSTAMTKDLGSFVSSDEARHKSLISCLRRHQYGDWGDLDADDIQANEDALKNGGRILSSYTIDGEDIWIITEGDRSSTTAFFPREY